MTSNTSGGSGANWSGVLIALIGAVSTLAVTWLTIQHSANAAPAPPAPVVQTQASIVASPSVQAMVIIPDVRNGSLQQAQQQLTALGLTVVVTNTPDQQPTDTILSINPAPGQTVAAGTEVVVQVSSGPAPSPSHQSPQTTNEKDGKGKKNN